MTKKRLLIITTALAMIMVTLTLALPRYLHLDTYKATILAELQKQLHRQVRYDSSQVSIGLGAVFTFNNIQISEPESPASFLSANRLRVTVAILPLIHGKLVIRDLSLEQPNVTIIKYADGRFNISDLLEVRSGQTSLHLHKIELNQAALRFIDHAINQQQPLITVLTATDLSLRGFERGKKGSIKLKTTIPGATTNGELAISGKYILSGPGTPLSATKLDMKLAAQHLDAANTWSYYQRYVPFKQVLGLFDLESTFSGTLSDFAAKGKISVGQLYFDYQPIFHAVLRPKQVHASYTLQVSATAVDVKALDLNIDGGLRVKGSCNISGIDGRNPRITAKAVTSPIDLVKFNAYIPYGIITKDVADYIEQRVKGGILHLDEGRIDGTVEQIVTMGVGTNYNILFINAHIEEGIVSYGPANPLFNSIKGRLQLKGKDFILADMSGRYGNSPFTANGRITDYPPTPAPCTFPFTMQMNPQQTEVAWLLGKERGKRLSFAGDAPFTLAGEGTTAHYLLSGSWHLTKSQYAYPDVIQKPAGKNSSLAFKAALLPNELQIHSASYSLGPLQLSLTGKWNYASPNSQTSLVLGTNNFMAQEVAPLLPKVSHYQPEGLLQAALTATGSEPNPATMSWKGNIRLSKFGVRPTDKLKALRGVSGTVTLHDHSIESGQIAAVIGDTSVSGSGRYQWGPQLAWNLAFTTPKVYPADFGFATTGTAPAITAVKGVVSYGNDQLAIKQLSGQINKSALTIRGNTSLIDVPTATLAISSPYLAVADLVSLSQFTRQPAAGINERSQKPWHVTAAVNANSGLIGPIAFSSLRTQAELKDAILYLQSYDFQAYGGKVSGKSRLDFGAALPRYQIASTVTDIDTSKLLAGFEVKDRRLTGTLSMNADITCKGNNVADYKQSALGTATLTITDGSINRYPILSKIFSILNVSQLLKFQLPDMVSGGMPFDELFGSFAISDGIISTKDLYMASDAINLSAVGTMNLPRNELSATIGVQPLQTIDKVVSHIPIVGWILTGKDKTLITTYFEAKGPANDPKVTAIPVKSMAKGTLDIFKRVFTLPAKLITDTGEVLLNK